MFIEPKDVNSLGLAFDIIGAWLVAIEVVKQFRGRKYEIDDTWKGFGKPPWDSDEYRQWESAKFKFMWGGLICLTLGFSLQITSNYFKSIHISTYPNTNAAHATKAPVQNSHAKSNLSPTKKDNAPATNTAIKKN